MDEQDPGFAQMEYEWRTCVTVIQAAAEILRDYNGLPDAERSRFLDAILDESMRLRRTFESLPEGVERLVA